MKKEHLLSKFKGDLNFLGFYLLVFYIFLQIHYYQESPLNLLKLIAGYLYLFIIPGYAIMLNYHKELSFTYRFAIGTGLGFAIQGILVYIVNIFVRVQIKNFFWILPLATVFTGIIILKRIEKNMEE